MGAVCAREVSRFARNSRDWQQLIEMCRVVDTVLVDQETIYAPRHGNDRLLLGLKGSLNVVSIQKPRMSFVPSAATLSNGKCRPANGPRLRPSSPSCSAIASSEPDGNPAPRTRFPTVPRRGAHRRERIEEGLEDAGLAQAIEAFPHALPRTEALRQRAPANVLDGEEMKRLEGAAIVLGLPPTARQAGAKHCKRVRPIVLIHLLST